ASSTCALTLALHGGLPIYGGGFFGISRLLGGNQTNRNIQVFLIGINPEVTLVDDFIAVREGAQSFESTGVVVANIQRHALAVKILAGIHIRERYIDIHGGGFFGISRLLGGNQTNRNIQVFLIGINPEVTLVDDFIAVREGAQSFESTGVVVANIQRHALAIKILAGIHIRE